MATTTPNLHLVEPATGDQNWGNTVDQDLTTIDNAIGNLQSQAASGAVSSVFGRSGAVTAESGDYSFTMVAGTVSLSQLPIIPVTGGGTGSTTAASARTALGAAASGANADITSLAQVLSLTLIDVDQNGAPTGNNQTLTSVNGSINWN